MDLYMDKVKNKTLLKDFQHKIITESRANEYRTKKTRSKLERTTGSKLQVRYDREGSNLQQIMRQTSNSNIVDYRIVTERSPLDRKMVNAHLTGEKSPKLKP